jgi:small-conductance mechanosensitive channel
LGFLFWLYLLLNFYSLITPLTAMAQAALTANLAIGSLNISVGRILTFLIAVWASFLVSKFLRFLLQEDVYHHFRLASGVPYAISTMLHYAILSRIGIRASVIRTSDGSEVIVPNGLLISSQVTNWTFSDQQRAVEVSVNVVSGWIPSAWSNC